MGVKATVSAAILLAACGGKIGEQPGAEAGTSDGGMQADAADTGPSSDPSAEVGVVADPCKLSDGTPVCGVVACPPPHPQPASQDGCGSATWSCEPFRDATDKLSDFGVCVQDIAKVGASYKSCVVCDDGLLCASMVTYPSPVCVQPAICDRLAQDGMTSACWWSDKSAWKPGETIPPVTCPAAAGGIGICGESCPSCGSGLHCTGRSPTHPLGVCEAVYTSRCNGPAGGGFTCGSGQACFSFKTDPTNQSLSDSNGFCMPVARCKGLRDTLPGGAFCKDASGVEIP
jgi:hypothetical protein